MGSNGPDEEKDGVKDKRTSDEQDELTHVSSLVREGEEALGQGHRGLAEKRALSALIGADRLKDQVLAGSVTWSQREYQRLADCYGTCAVILMEVNKIFRATQCFYTATLFDQLWTPEQHIRVADTLWQRLLRQTEQKYIHIQQLLLYATDIADKAEKYGKWRVACLITVDVQSAYNKLLFQYGLGPGPRLPDNPACLPGYLRLARCSFALNNHNTVRRMCNIVLTEYCDYNNVEALEIWAKSLFLQQAYDVAFTKISLALDHAKTPEEKSRLAKAVCLIQEKLDEAKRDEDDPDAEWLEGTQGDREHMIKQKIKEDKHEPRKKKTHRRPKSRDSTAERSKSVSPKPVQPVVKPSDRPSIADEDSCIVSTVSPFREEPNINNSNSNAEDTTTIYQRAAETSQSRICQIKEEATKKHGHSRGSSKCSSSSYTDASFELSSSGEEFEDETLSGQFEVSADITDLTDDTEDTSTTFYEQSCRVHGDKATYDEDIDAPSDTQLLQSGLQLNMSYLQQLEAKSAVKWGPFYEQMLDESQLRSKLLEPKKYKRCTIEIEGSHQATCTPIEADSDMSAIEISGRSKAGQAFNEDEVVVELLDNHEKKNEKRYGCVLGILNRRLKDVKHPVFVCTLDDIETHLVRPMCKTIPKLHVMNKEIMDTCPQQKKYKVELYDYNHRQGILEFSRIVDVVSSDRDKYIFLVAYISWNRSHIYPRGAILKMLPYGDSLKSGLKILDLQYEVPMLYKRSTVKRLESMSCRLGDEPKASLLKGRTDLTKLNTFTIDPPGSQDLDDALSIEEHVDGYKVGVHIADVSTYIEKGDAIDTEAKERAMTFYPGIKKPRTMIPEPLSNNIGSLLPGKKRLTLTVFFYLDDQGRPIQMEGNNFDIVKSYINSRRQFTYSEAQAIIEMKIKSQTDSVSTAINQLFNLAHKIRKRRLGNAMYAMDLDTADTQGDDDINNTLEAHYLVEEFMILANQQVAKCLYKKFGQTVPLRCQPPPSKEGMQAFVNQEGPVLDIMLRLQDRQICGYKKPSIATAMEQTSERNAFAQKWLWNAVESGVKGSLKFVKMDDHHPLQHLAYLHWLAIQEPADYKCSGSIKTSEDGKHYSLGMYPYTHFTSPIRRYIDVVVHRQLHDLLARRSSSYTKHEVEDICLHSNSVMKKSKAYQESCKTLQKAIQLKSVPKMINCFIDDVSDRGVTLCAPEMKHVAKNYREMKFNLLNMGFKPEVNTDTKTGVDIVKATWRKRLYDTKGFSATPELKQDDIKVLNPHPETIFVPIHSWATIVRFAIEGRSLDLRSSVTKARSLPSATGLDDVSTECRDAIQIKPNTKFSMSFTHGQTVRVQMTAEPQKGMLSPRPQLYNMTRNVKFCLQHMQDPVLQLSYYSTKSTQDMYKNANQYVERWLPLMEMEAATGAVGNEESCNINGLPVNISGRGGSFVLPLSFCELRNIELSGIVDDDENEKKMAQSHDWLCLKYTVTAKQMTEVTTHCSVPIQNNVWIGHAQVTGVNRKKAEERGNDQDGKMIITFSLHSRAPNLPPEIQGQKSPRFNVEILSKAEVDRRTEYFLKQLPSTDCSLAQRIALNNGPIPPLDSEHQHEADNLMERDLYIPDNNEDRRKRPLPRNNHRQQEAIDKALQSRFSLIQGPPGTGKTYTGIKLLYLFDKINGNWAKQGHQRKQVLFCGPSNKSVDLVAKWMLFRLGDLQPDFVRVYGRSIEAGDFPIPGRTFLTKRSTRSAQADSELNSIALHHLIRQEGKPYAEAINAIDRKFEETGYEPNPSLVRKYVHLVREASIDEIRKHDVILCTTAVGSNPKILEATNVFQVIIDEAGMCPEPHCLVPIIATKAEQVVLIGDHKQLRPIIMCKHAAELGLGTSLFERYALSKTSRNVEFTMLEVQYRMNPQICRFPSNQFYDGKLKTRGGAWSGNTLTIWPAGRAGGDYPHVMIHVEGEEKMMTVSAEEGNEHSVSNTQEVNLVVKLFRYLMEDEQIRTNQVNVISQYNAQCYEIREALKKEGIVNFNVNTVVSSQGGEWDYVIFSTVRSLPDYKIEKNPTLGWCKSNMGFITDPNQINVALTRARKGLIIIGNLNLLRCDKIFGKLISHYEERHCVKTVEEFPPKKTRQQKMQEAIAKSEQVFGDERFISGQGLATSVDADKLDELEAAHHTSWQSRRHQHQPDMARGTGDMRTSASRRVQRPKPPSHFFD